MGDCLDFVSITNVNTINKIDIYDPYFLFVNVFLFYFLDGSPGRHRPVSDETHDGCLVLFNEPVRFLFTYQGTEFIVCDLLYYTVHFFYYLHRISTYFICFNCSVK